MPNYGNLASVVKKRDGAIQQMSIRETNCVVHWTETEIYPVGSAIHPLNNWGLQSQNFLFCTILQPPPPHNQSALPLTGGIEE